MISDEPTATVWNFKIKRGKKASDLDTTGAAVVRLNPYGAEIAVKEEAT